MKRYISTRLHGANDRHMKRSNNPAYGVNGQRPWKARYYWIGKLLGVAPVWGMYRRTTPPGTYRVRR